MKKKTILLGALIAFAVLIALYFMIEEEVRILGNNIKVKQVTVNQLIKERDSLHFYIDSLQKNYIANDEELKTLREAYNELESVIKEFQTTKDTTGLKQLLVDLIKKNQKEFERVKKYHDDFLKRKISNDLEAEERIIVLEREKGEDKRRIAELEKEVLKYKMQLKNITEYYEKKIKEIEANYEKKIAIIIKEKDEKIRELTKQNAEYIKIINENSILINELKEKNSKLIEANIGLEKKMKSIQSNLLLSEEEKKELKKKYQEQIADYNTELSNNKEQIQKSEQKITELNDRILPAFALQAYYYEDGILSKERQRNLQDKNNQAKKIKSIYVEFQFNKEKLQEEYCKETQLELSIINITTKEKIIDKQPIILPYDDNVFSGEFGEFSGKRQLPKPKKNSSHVYEILITCANGKNIFKNEIYNFTLND